MPLNIVEFVRNSFQCHQSISYKWEEMGFARDITKVQLSKSIPTAVFHCTNILLYSNTISRKLTKSQGHVFLCSIQPKPSGTESNDATNYSNFTKLNGLGFIEHMQKTE